MTEQVSQWHSLAQQLRIDSIRCSTAAGSGHPTSSLSAADLMSVLMSSCLQYDFKKPDDPANDHLIFSKGHASPLLYSMFKASGAISDQELMSYRKFGSRLQGHPVPILPWVDVATGSLGQGLPIGVGVALAGKYLDKLPYRVWVLLGDSEMAEGSVWEAFSHAAHYKLNNLIGILDMNRLGQRGETELGWNSGAYAARARGFGWTAIEIDGHNFEQIDGAFSEALQPGDAPVLVVAKTCKGRGVSFLENKDGWHGKTLTEEQAQQAIKELGEKNSITISVKRPQSQFSSLVSAPSGGPARMKGYEMGTSIATRKAYGETLRELGASRSDLAVLDAEVGNSTFAEDFAKAFPDRFFEMYIAEQQMVAAAVGISVRRRVAFASTFAAFLTRAYDFIRMAAISRADVRICGSHAGVSIGEDGPSQMALEDLAMMRAVWGSTVLYPCDGNQTAHLVAAMADKKGISFIRTTREKTPIIYKADEKFTIGGSRVVRQSEEDKVTVVAAGITVHQALKACDQLLKEGIAVRLIDAYSVKPFDAGTLSKAVKNTGGRLVVVEDHWKEGGLGSAALEALVGVNGFPSLKYRHLAVKDMPGSGTPQELMDAAGIGTSAIVEAIRELASVE